MNKVLPSVVFSNLSSRMCCKCWTQ